jgi:radical SAM superfamily enzyme YgiQ (UPF0313 family)
MKIKTASTNRLKSYSTSGAKVLLISPPVYDIRLDWSKWHQPAGLLQVGNLLRTDGQDVVFLDCLESSVRKRVERRKIGTVSVDGVDLTRWHFGWSWKAVEERLNKLSADNWKPNAIYVSCAMSFWWESTRDLVKIIRAHYPKTPIVLGGIYPSLYPDHAKRNIAGVRFDTEGIGRKARSKATDFSLYEKPPLFAGIYLYRSSSANKIVHEIAQKKEGGVNQFAFYDNEIPGKDPKHFENVLDLIIQRKLKIALIALGNLSPKSLTVPIIRKMKEAGYRQIFLHDDLALNKNVNGDLSKYERGIGLLLKYGGYRPRTDDITAMVQIGVPGENLEQVTEKIIRVSHLVGSVNLVPYQPTAGTAIYKQHQSYLEKIPLEMQNAKLYPFAKLNGLRYSDYQEVVRLATLLNSKYRSTTFDFLGNNEMADMVRRSIAEETWKPKISQTIPLLPK